MFTTDEARALIIATRIAQPWLDPVLARAAGDAMSRVMSVLSASMRAEVERLPLYALVAGLEPEVAQWLQVLREAVQARQVVRFHHIDAAGQATERTVRPLGCFYWGQVWTLVAWCQTRDDFRRFRVDRMSGVQVLEQRFGDVPGQTLQDLLRREAACVGGAVGDSG